MYRYHERRQHTRIPASGTVVWRSGLREGRAELVNISAGGAGLRISVRRAAQLGREMDFDVSFDGTSHTHVSKARVVRREPDDDGQCLVGVAFAAGVN